MKAEIITDHKADIFKAGFKAAGYELTVENKHPDMDDVLVTWNRKPSNAYRIKYYEDAGARVIIAENGYIGKDENGNKLLSMAHNYHLGAGSWYIGPEKRYLKQGFTIEPWRAGGEDIVLLAQRGIGNAKRHEWYLDLAEKLKKQTHRKVRVRKHPGKNPTPLLPEIENAHAVVTWSSAAALTAMAFGVPVFYLMPDWIGAGAAIFGVRDIERPYRGDRTEVFHRVGWAQWKIEEILSGEAVRKVMSA